MLKTKKFFLFKFFYNRAIDHAWVYIFDGFAGIAGARFTYPSTLLLLKKLHKRLSTRQTVCLFPKNYYARW